MYIYIRNNLNQHKVSNFFSLLFIFLFTLIFSNSIFAASPVENDTDSSETKTITISGIITLPTEAPSGGISISIYAINKTKTEFSHIEISEGQTTANYSLAIPLDSSRHWNIQYSCDSQKKCNTTLLARGYYAKNKPNTTSRYINDATSLAGGSDHSNINMSVLTLTTISGVITLLEPAPKGGIYVGVDILQVYDKKRINADSKPRYPESTPIYFNEGDSIANYSIPSNYPDYYEGITPKLIVRYNCVACKSPSLKVGYYTIKDGTTWNPDAASLLSENLDHNNINLTVLTGNTIKGTVTLPKAAPVGGVSVHISAYKNFSGLTHETIVIEEGKITGDYSLGVPPDSSSRWYIGYSCHRWCDQLFISGYYAKEKPNTTSLYQNDATYLTGGTDYRNIDMSIPNTKKSISGTVTLAQPAPPGGMFVSVDIVSGNSFDHHSGIDFNEGDTVASYSIEFFPDLAHNWTVSYSCYACKSPLLKTGYYTKEHGTSWNKKIATPLAGNSNHSDINLIVLTGNTISGTIILPKSTPKMSIVVSAEDQSNSKRFIKKTVHIAENQVKANYSLRIPADSSTNWLIQYSCKYCDPILVQHGFYANEKPNTTSLNQKNATPLIGDKIHTNINMSVLNLTTKQANLTVKFFGYPVGKVDINPTKITCNNSPFEAEPCSQTFDKNTDIQLTAVSTDGNVFTHWEGDCLKDTSKICNIKMTSSKKIIAHFQIDSDNDGMPDAWEKLYNLNPFDPNDANFDPDNDGINNIDEYKQDNNPLIANSINNGTKITPIMLRLLLD